MGFLDDVGHWFQKTFVPEPVKDWYDDMLGSIENRLLPEDKNQRRIVGPIVGAVAGAPFGPAGIGIGAGLGSFLGSQASGDTYSKSFGKALLGGAGGYGAGSLISSGLPSLTKSPGILSKFSPTQAGATRSILDTEEGIGALMGSPGSSAARLGLNSSLAKKFPNLMGQVGFPRTAASGTSASGGGAAASSGLGGSLWDIAKGGLGQLGSGLLKGVGQGLGGMLDNMFNPQVLGPAAAGASVASIPYMGIGPQTPEVPKLNELQTVQNYVNTSNQLYGDLKSRIQGIQNVTLPPDMQGMVKRQFDRTREQVASQFKMFRPGADMATDSEFRIQMQDIAAQEAQTLAQLQMEYQAEARANLALELNMTPQQLEGLAALANADIMTIIAQTGLDADEAKQFKEIFGKLGSVVAQGAYEAQKTTKSPGTFETLFGDVAEGIGSGIGSGLSGIGSGIGNLMGSFSLGGI